MYTIPMMEYKDRAIERVFDLESKGLTHQQAIQKISKAWNIEEDELLEWYKIT